jgi:predicted small lipoprotein YifL
MKNFITKNILAKILASSVIFVILYSCGFKGPLYLPKKPVASSPQKSASSPTKTASSAVNTTAQSETLNKESSIVK